MALPPCCVDDCDTLAPHQLGDSWYCEWHVSDGRADHITKLEEELRLARLILGALFRVPDRDMVAFHCPTIEEHPDAEAMARLIQECAP